MNARSNIFQQILGCIFFKKETQSVWVKFFKVKLGAITIETNKIFTLKYKLDTMESELS